MLPPRPWSPWAVTLASSDRSTNLNRLRRLLALALSVHLRRYKPNFLVLHYRPGDALGDQADTDDCQPGGDLLQDRPRRASESRNGQATAAHRERRGTPPSKPRPPAHTGLPSC